MKSYTGTTRTLDSAHTSYRSVVFKPSKPPLDSELNFLGDLPHEMDKFQIQQVLHSGFYPLDYAAFEMGYDNSGNAFGVNLTNVPNQFVVRNPNGAPFKVNIFGEVLELGGTNSADSSKLVITLPPAPSSGSRQDLVYLEVWYQELVAGSPNNKPAVGKIYPFGNVQSGMTALDDEIYYSPIGTETTQRVQMQYRLRVVPGVNFGVFPDGIHDTVNVKAQAGRAAPSSVYSFARHATDSGLYIAGDGDGASISDLGTVDGYVYAIPLFRVHRRNAAPFNLLNLNGAGKTMAQTPSDRPDGYFNDKIEKGDIEDMRHICVVALNSQRQLDYAFKLLIEGNLGTILTESLLGADLAFNSTGLHIDGISVVDQTGALDVAAPNAQRRIFSDSESVQPTIRRVVLADRSLVLGINWTTGDQFSINLLGSNPPGTKFGERPIRAFCIVKSGSAENKVEVPITIEPVGDSALIVTLGAIPLGVANQQLFVDYDIVYPSGNGLTHVPVDVKKVFELRDNVNFSFVSDNDADGIRQHSLVATEPADDYRIAKHKQEGFTSLGFMQRTGDGTQSYTLDAAHGGVPITHIHYVLVNGTLISRTTSPLNIQQVNQNFDNTITIVFNNAIAINTPMTFGVGLATNAVRLQEKTKGVVETSQIEILSKTILAGQNLNQIVIPSTGIIFSAQSEKLTPSSYQDICYVDGLATPCTTTIDGNFIKLVLGSNVGVGSNNTVSVVVNRSKPLDANQQLQISYMFVPYQGVTARQSFGNGANSYVKTRLIDKAVGFLVHTSGTNGMSGTIPDDYAPISVKLPKAFTDKDAMLANVPLGAFIYPYHKGIGLSADYTVSGAFAANDFEVLYNWNANTADTTGINVDSVRGMYNRSTVRFNKTGTVGTVAEIIKNTYKSDWSGIINASGDVAPGYQLSYWVYMPDATSVQSFGMHLIGGTGSHIYKKVGNFVTGWNRVIFTKRNDGTATSSNVTQVKFVVEVDVPSTTIYGFNVFGPYMETVSPPNFEVPRDGDVWFGQKEQRLMKYQQLRGSQQVSDGAGINFFKDRAYSFDVPVVSGINDINSKKVQPYVLGKENFISKNGVINSRGTYKGSNFYSIGMDTISAVKKQTVMYLLEQVLEDPTGNFAVGEYVLRVETKMSDGTLVEISNSDFSSANAFDLFRLKGRPVGKL